MPGSLTTKVEVGWQRRLSVFLTVLYAGALSVASSGGQEPSAWLCAVAAAVLAVTVGRWAGVTGGVGWGLSLVVVSSGGRGMDAGRGMIGAIGVLACSASACLALTRIAPSGGVSPLKETPPRRWLVPLAAIWCAVIVSALYPRARVLRQVARHPDLSDCVAIAATAAIVLGCTEWSRRRRSLDLAVVERTLAARSLQATVFCFSLVAAVTEPAFARAICRLGLGIASASTVWACTATDAVRVARAGRRTMALALVGGVVVLCGLLAAQIASTAWTVIATAGVALAVGSAAPWLERPFRPLGGAWLDAFERAREDAARAEPDDAIRAALMALRKGPGEASPELWTFAPSVLTTVDAAGYAREQAAETPSELLAVVAGEPETTLRAEVLEALEVRRPDLRPLSAWMAQRKGLLASLVAWENEPEGILVLPQAERGERLTLEEIRAIRRVAESLAGACRARAVSSRMRDRVQEAAGLVEAAGASVRRASADRDRSILRSAQEEERLARRADIGIYSAAARMAVETLERRLTSGACVALVAPSGLDPAPFLARAHRTGAREAAPLVFVDGLDAAWRAVDRWLDAVHSPLVLADGGILAVLDIGGLPAEVQHLIGRAYNERRAPWDEERTLNIQLVLSTVGAGGRLYVDPELARAMGDALLEPVVLPPLGERADDLRALVIEGLSSEGVRSLGRSVGIEPAAYARLADYEFPGDVAELTVLIERLVARSKGRAITLADLEEVGFRGVLRKRGGGESRARKDPMSS